MDCVANAVRALECLRMAHRDGRPYDVAIVDHQMPDMDGMALARAIKSDPALATIPLVLLTSVSYRGATADAQHAGFSAFVLKPIRQSQLYDCIVTVMGRASEPAPARLITHHTLSDTRLRARVLVAEDNVVNQRLAARMLEKLGCRVDVVANGLEALEAVGRISYQVVFMDCQMPEMDGYEATTAIRRREASSGAHVPDRRHDGECHGGRSRALPGRRDGRLRLQAGGAPRAEGRSPEVAPVSLTERPPFARITGNSGGDAAGLPPVRVKLDTPRDPRL